MSPPTLPVTVVIPAFNREHLLAEALASVHAQTLRPAEVLVVDDCSSDATAEVAERLGATVLRHATNQGAASARNSGFDAAGQEWIALLDSDDRWLPWHLETVWEHRGAHVLVAGSSLQVDDAGRPARVSGPVQWRDRVLSSPGDLIFPENVVAASGAMVRRSTVAEVGGYDTSLRYSEDFDLWLRLLRHGTGVCLSRVTVVYHIHEGQKSRHRADAGEAQQLIAQRAIGDGSRRPVERRIGVRLWDDGREALREGDRKAAARSFAAVVRRPQRLVGVVAIWGWRRLVRRRARALTPDGRERVAVVGGPLPSDGTVEDWRHRPLTARIRAMAVAPPRSTVSPRRADRWLSRAFGVEHRSADD